MATNSITFNYAASPDMVKVEVLDETRASLAVAVVPTEDFSGTSELAEEIADQVREHAPEITDEEIEELLADAISRYAEAHP